MKIIGFAQLRNELSKGNLENWAKCMEICDYVYIYDQGSNDGSHEFYKTKANWNVIYSPTNRFGEEIVCKAELLEKLLADHPDVDGIFWMDGDTILDNRLLVNNGSQLRSLVSEAKLKGIDCYRFGHYNLWRSDVYYRLDSQYNDLNGIVKALWINNGNLSFPKTLGLHHSQHPSGLSNVVYCGFNLIHKGFSTDEQIVNRYKLYKGLGQNGWSLDRLIEENGLRVEHLPEEIIPEWYLKNDIENPVNKKTIKELYSDLA